MKYAPEVIAWAVCLTAVFLAYGLFIRALIGHS